MTDEQFQALLAAQVVQKKTTEATFQFLMARILAMTELWSEVAVKTGISREHVNELVKTKQRHWDNVLSEFPLPEWPAEDSSPTD